TGRTKHYLSICGEHLSVDNMNRGIQHVEEELDISIPEFTVAAVEVGSFYAHKWYIGSDASHNVEKIKTLLDAKLKEINDDYRVERASVLREIEVEVIPANIFYKWHEHQGKMGGQHKFPRVMKKERFRDWEEFVRRNLVN
ncbi:MAG TPA: GH3 auxin-responsive promoter family protein, partial [Haliscomenobacter sp.]|nr:GH3 auxin-responsive promoter family protein [Haliscomenobacter sp.]